MPDEPIARTFALGNLTSLSLHAKLGVGEIVVECVDQLDQAVVTLTPRTSGSRTAADTVVELRGDTLSVIAPKPSGFGAFLGRLRDRVDVTITVPTGTALTIGSFAGSITVRGRCGDVDITTGSARVTLEDVDGNLRLRCGSGTCWVEAVHGSVAIKAGSGSVSVGEVDDSLDCTTGSGSVEIGVARDSVRMRTGSGDARVGAAHGNVDVTSGSGDMRIGIPTGVTARLDLTTGSGRVDSDLAVSGDAPVADAGASLRKIVRTSVRARTGSGDIALVRAATSAA